MNKKSKIVGIGLLVLSIAGCRSNHQMERRRVDDYQNNPNYYIDNGAGYHHGGISPFWIYWMMTMNSRGNVYYYPTYVHQSYGRNGTYYATSMGQRTSLSRSSISRGGFRSKAMSVSRGGFGKSGMGHSTSS